MSVVVYHFWSPTCAPCKIIKPAVDELKEEFPSVTWKSINIADDTSNIGSNLGVSVVPTIVVKTFDNDGMEIKVEKHSGTQIAGYYRILRNATRTIQQSLK